jgi:hypothetical protein
MENKLLSTCQEFMDFNSPTTTGEIQMVCMKIQVYLASCDYQFSQQDFVSAFNLADAELMKTEHGATWLKQFESKMFVIILFLFGSILFKLYVARNAVATCLLLFVASAITLLTIYKERKLMPNYHRCFCVTFAIRFFAEQNNFDVGRIV